MQQILEKRYGQAFAIEEVKEIGDGLIDFHALLLEIRDKAAALDE